MSDTATSAFPLFAISPAPIAVGKSIYEWLGLREDARYRSIYRQQDA